MSKYDKSLAPYNDNGEEELQKQYYQLLALPGRVAQAREISTLQTILQGIIKSLGDSILKNGDIIEGCQIITAIDKKSITVTEGKVYVDGMVSKVSKSVVPIKGVGSETVCVKIKDTIITEYDDINLRDPAQGYDNFNQAGCHRIKRELLVVVDDPEGTPIARLIDGELVVESYAPSYDALEQTLARRTYDESGSYLVSGLEAHVESKKDSDTEYNVVIEAGKAYVLGYELKIPTARRLVSPRSLTVAPVSVSNYVFRTNTLSYMLDTNPYVQSIISVVGRVNVTEQQVATINTDSILLSHTDVVEILSIKQGSATFTPSKSNSPSDGDYYLLRDGTRYYVKWNGRKAPVPGNSYTVVYSYNKVFKQGTEYNLSVSSQGSYLNFISNSTAPVDGTGFKVDYNQYLARKDLVYLDQYGNLNLILGNPDEDGFEVAPAVPVNTLALALVYNPPGGLVNSIPALNIKVSNIGLTRFTMNDIQKILDRVVKTEYNQAILTLNDDARNRSTINSKKGILADPLVDFSRIDLYYNKTESGNKIDSSKPIYDMALNLERGIAYLPLNVYTYKPNGTTFNNTKSYKRLVTLDSKSTNVVLQQPNATKSFLVNPYSVFPQLPEVTVTPSVDSWVEETTIDVPISLTNETIVNTTISTLYTTVTETRAWTGLARLEDHRLGQEEFIGSTTEETGRNYSSLGTTSETSNSISLISEKAITYMRQIEVTIEGKGFPENKDNIKCEFDGILVNLTPISGTSSGTLPGTLRANELGVARGKFTIPANVRTGVREVRMFYDDISIDGYKNSGYTIFQSSGISRTLQNTITTVTTVLLQEEIVNTQTDHFVVYELDRVDPVGQTFVLDRVTILSAIDVYFEEKSNTNESIVLEIRNVVNGTIGSTIYGRKILYANEIKISKDASVATRFTFDNPIVLDRNVEYAFTLRSSSDRYRVWVSEIGGTDVRTGDLILKNSYLTGVMMSSSNNSSWTIHQTMDMKFNLIEDVYEPTGSITFAPISVDNITRLELAADSVILDGTSLTWYYSIDNGNTFTPIAPNTLRDLKTVAKTLILKVNLSKNVPNNITPLLALDSLLLIGSSYRTEGDYIGVNVLGMDPYTDVTLIMDVYTPSGTSVTPSMSHDNGKTQIPLVMDDSQTKPLNSGWRELTYRAKVPSGGTSNQCRIFIHANSSSTVHTPMFRSIRIIMT